MSRDKKGPKYVFPFKSTVSTGWQLNNGPPNTKVIFSCNKRLNFATKFGVLGFLGIANLQKKFGDSISKIVDFFLMSNFCQSQFCFLRRVITSKSQTSEKNPQFLRQSHQIFFASCQYPKTQVYQIWNKKPVIQVPNFTSKFGPW